MGLEIGQKIQNPQVQFGGGENGQAGGAKQAGGAEGGPKPPEGTGFPGLDNQQDGKNPQQAQKLEMNSIFS